MRRRRFLVNLAVVAGTLLFMLVAGEAILRLFTPAVEGENTLRSFTRFDPTLGWRGVAQARGKYSTRDFTIQVIHDDHGFRSGPGPAPEERPAGATRVITVGDSYGWGFGVEQSEIFTTRLQELAPGLQVLNMAVSGYGPDQELLLLREEGFARRPDVVLVQFSLLNDLFTILAPEAYHLPKPYFSSTPEGLRLEGLPVPRLAHWDRISESVAVREWLTTNVRLYGWGRLRWRVLRARLQGTDSGRPAEMSRVRMLARQPDETVDAGWRLAEILLATMQAEAAAGGATLVILAVADPLQVDDDLWESGVVQAGLPVAAYDWDLPDRRLAEVGQRLGIPVVDPLTRFRQHARAGETLYVSDQDPHWNAAGHLLAAQELAAFFTAREEALAHP